MVGKWQALEKHGLAGMEWAVGNRYPKFFLGLLSHADQLHNEWDLVKKNY